MRRSYIKEPLGEQRTMYEAYCEVMLDVIKRNRDVVMVYADFPKGSVGDFLEKNNPDRVIDLGIAEANVMATSGGLAAAGKVPFTHCHAIFGIGRGYNAIRQCIAYDCYNVKMILCNCGVLWPHIGASHQGLEELAALRAIPNLVIISPADPVETKAATEAAAEYNGPVAIRLSFSQVPTVYEEGFPFEWGKAVTVADGKDATVISTGVMLADCLKALDILHKDGINVRLLDMHTIKPLDQGSIIQAAKETGAIITVEDNNIIGGLGSAVSEVIAENSLVPMKRVGVKDIFGEPGTVEELKTVFGITPDDIAKLTKETIGRKLNSNAV